MDLLKRLFRKKNIPEVFISPSNVLRRLAIQYLETIGYKFVKEIGHGSFGQVIAVKCPKSKKKVAVKIMPPDATWQEELEEWPRFNHPNVLPLLETIRLQKFDLFIMPIAKTTLYDILQGRSLQSSSGFHMVKIWLEDVLNGLQYLHENGTCHLDLKVDNVLITREKKALICDFSMINDTSKPVRRFGLPTYYHPPEAFKSSNPSAEVDGRAFDIYSYGLLCLYSFTAGWYDSMVLQCYSWHEDLYPLLFDALQLPFFKYQIGFHFPKANVLQSQVYSALNMVQTTLWFRPDYRPQASILLQHGFFSGNFEKTLDVDRAWLQRCTWPEDDSKDKNASQNLESYECFTENFPVDISQAVHDTFKINVQNCEDIPEILQEAESRALHAQNLQNFENSTKHCFEDNSQVILNPEIGNLQCSEHSAKIVLVDNSQATLNPEIANLQRSEHSPKIVLEDNFQAILNPEIANLQRSEHSPKIVLEDNLQAILNPDIANLQCSEHSPKIVLVDSSQDMLNTEIANLQCSEQTSKIALEHYSKGILNPEIANLQRSEYSPNIVLEDNLQTIHNTEIANLQCSEHSLKIVLEDNLQAILNPQIANLQCSEHSPKIVSVDNSQDMLSTEIANLQCSELSSKIALEHNLQAMLNPEIANLQRSEYSPNIVLEDNLQTILNPEIASLQCSEHSPKSVLVDDSEVILNAEIANPQCSEHSTEIFTECRKTIRMTNSEHLSEDESQAIRDTLIIRIGTSSNEQLKDLTDILKKTENVKVNEEPGVVQKDGRPRRKLFSGLRKWRIWKIFTCKSRKNGKSKNNEVE